jgi:N-acetyl-anhydromuramyl-L-alanine amidase AmpD
MARTYFAPAHPECIMARKPGIALDRIIIHTMEGTFGGSLAWFQQGKDKPGRAVPTAAHYLVGRNGDVCQMVPDDQKCYHAGNYNSRSIGIEHEARIASWPVRRLANGAIKPPPYPAMEFPAAMLSASARVVAALCAKYGIPADRQHIIGHNEVPGATHTDPGPAFPWADFMGRLAGSIPALGSTDGGTL